MKSLFLFLCLGLPCAGVSPSPLVPISIKMELENRVEIKLGRELFGSLKLVTLIVEGVAVSIPEEEIKDIADPQLSTVNVQATQEDGGRQFYINLEFDRRPYAWSAPGTGEISKVTFVVIDGSYRYRNVTIPVGKDRWATNAKKAGEKEREGEYYGGKVEGLR